MGVIIHKVFLILALVFAEQSNNEELIEWQKSVPLSWSDFKGRPQNQGDVVALTSSGILFKLAIKEANKEIIGFDTQVNTHFYPKRSWVHKKKASDHILAHEQLHFDITELHARKFKKKISTIKISKNIKRDLDKTYEDIIKEMQLMQRHYDMETQHSRDAKAQSAWKIKIDKALEVYSAY